MQVILGDLTKMQADALVNAANGYVGVMGAGVARAIRDVGGHVIESEARRLCRQHPHEEGTTYVTGAGELQAKHVIHAVTMRYPAGRTSLGVVERCLRAVFVTAAELQCKTVIIPGLGTRTGRAPLDEVAALYERVIPQLEKEYGIEATVADINRAFISCFKGAA